MFCGDAAMNKLSIWQNIAAQLITGLFVVLVLEGVALINSEKIPAWGIYVGFMIGIILWSRPSYDRKQDFDK